MDTNLPVMVIQQLAQQAMDLSDVFASSGQHIAYALLVLTIIMFVLNLYGGLDMASATFEMVFWSAGAAWLTSYWSEVIRFCLTISDDAMRLLGAEGVGGLFALAARVVERISAEPAGWSLSVDGTAGAFMRAVVLGISQPLIALGLCMPALLALLAQVALILGGMVAPLVVGFLAFPITRSWGMSALTFMLAATVRVIILGAVSVVFGQAVSNALTLPGTNEALTTTMLAGLWLLSFLAVICAFGANSIASSLTGQGGALGLSTLTGVTSSVTRSVTSVVRSSRAA